MKTTVDASARRRWISWIVFVVVIGVAAFSLRGPLIAWLTGQSTGVNPGSKGLSASQVNAERAGQTPPEGTANAVAGHDIDHYTCSMHPSVKQKGAGKCPICGMDLIPVTKEQQQQGIVMIDASRRQLIGVRTGPVIEGPMRHTFRAVGHVTYDESTLSDVNLKTHGWITKLFVSKTGERVKLGQPLFTLYSPELYNAEQDFVLTTQSAETPVSAATGSPNRPQLLGRAARQRLHLFGLSDVQIEALAKRGAPEEDVVIAAPASGFVIEKNVVEGASVEPGMRLFRIAALSKVWVEAEVYEADLAHVRVGQRVTVTLDYLPERAYEASVAYVYPYLDMKTRTGRFRVELVNQQLELRPGMYASIELGSAEETRVQVPAAAVVYTGPRRLVFVDLGQGRFRPQEIRVGSEANGMYEVIAGLSPGDMVATSGVFLIAAEARISTAAKYWDDLSVSDQEHAPPTSGNPASGNPAAASGPHAEIYSCPMHPEVQSSTPGTCPKCGMALEPHGEKGAP